MQDNPLSPVPHPQCDRPDNHVCHAPSGQTCIREGCEKSAGTLWTPLWCPEHDAQRQDRITKNLEKILDDAEKKMEEKLDRSEREGE